MRLREQHAAGEHQPETSRRNQWYNGRTYSSRRDRQ